MIKEVVLEAIGSDGEPYKHKVAVTPCTVKGLTILNVYGSAGYISVAIDPYDIVKAHKILQGEGL